MLSSLSKLVESLARLKDFSWNESDWHEPERSIGIQCNSFGAYQCWEADGPAKQLFAEISADIAALLYARADEIDYGEPLAGHVLMFGLYMIGRDRSKARPTLLFSHPQPKPRQRAKKFVKESDILQRYPKVVLAESREAPMAQGLVGFRAKSPGRGLTEPTSIKSSSNPEFRISECNVYEIRASGNYSNPALFITSPLGKTAVIGLVVCYREKLYGVTVAHAFVKIREPNLNIDGTLSHHSTTKADDIDIERPHKKSGYNVEFAFDDDVEEESDVDEEKNIAMTSNGSISYNSSESGISSPLESLNPAPLKLFPRNDKNRNQDLLAGHCVGAISRSSVSKDGVGLDWALLEFSVRPPRAVKKVDLEWFEAAVSSTMPDTPREVHAVNGQGTIMQGTISPNPTMMRLPFCKDFQELWTVRFDGICEDGDCGSWVKDDNNGTLYGQIVAGHPRSGVAYIIPAAKLLGSIRTVLTKTEETEFGIQKKSLWSQIKPYCTEIFSATMRFFSKLVLLYGYSIIIAFLAIPLWNIFSPISLATLFRIMRKGTIQQPPDSMNESIVLQTPDIIVLCVIIIIMCIIVMEQKNLVSEQEIGRDMSAREQVSRIAKLAFVVILTPELVLAATYRDYCSVRNSHSEILIKGNHAVLVASRDTDLKPELHFGGVDLPRLLSREVVIQLRQAERSSPATTSNSSLLVEGHAKESIPILLLPWVVKVGRDSAHPLFAKWMMTAQVIWSSLEVLSRFVNASSVTPLEMSAAAYMVCSITAYYIWRQQLPEIERHLSQPIKARRIDEPGTDRLWQQTQHRDISSLKDIETMILFSDSWRWGLCFGGFIFGTLHLAAWDIYFPTVHSKQLWRMSCLALMSPLVLLILYRGFYKPVARNFGYLTSGKETPAALAKLSMFTMYLYICARSFLFFQSFRSWGFPANVD